MTPADQELIAKVKLGDKQAFTELYDLYAERILNYLYRYIGDYHAAKDLTIETFLKAHNNLKEYKEQGLFSSWLYKIATNCAKNELRTRFRRREVPIEELDLSGMAVRESERPDKEAETHEFNEFIGKAISKLGKKYREVLLLCDVDGLKYEEAADILQCNIKTIGTRVRRARKMFCDILKKHGYKGASDENS